MFEGCLKGIACFVGGFLKGILCVFECCFKGIVCFFGGFLKGILRVVEGFLKGMKLSPSPSTGAKIDHEMKILRTPMDSQGF